jgi:hypothetical protein
VDAKEVLRVELVVVTGSIPEIDVEGDDE